MKIALAGTGYVSLSNAVLLAQHNKAVALDSFANRLVENIHDVADKANSRDLFGQD